GKQAKPEDLVRREEVADVRARESAARRAIAFLVEWPLVEAEFSPLDVEPAVARERRAVPPHPRRRDAIEEVDAATDALDEVLGKAHAHEIARRFARQLGVDDVEDAVHVRLGLADGQAADAVADPVAGVANRSRRGSAQRLVDAALYDREE